LASIDNPAGIPNRLAPIFPEPLVVYGADDLSASFLPTSLLPNLQVVDLSCRLYESQLVNFGRNGKISLILLDVVLTGISVPDDLVALDDIRALSEAFWRYWNQRGRPFVQLRDPHPLQRMQIKAFKFPPDLTSLTLLGFTVLDPAELPRSLTRWHHAFISEAVHPSVYPKNLTELSLANTTFASMSFLMTAFPNLLKLRADRLTLDSSFIPPAAPIKKSKSKPKHGLGPATTSQLNLPADSRAYIAVRYPNLVIENSPLMESALFVGLTEFPPGHTHITLTGHTTIEPAFLESGFQKCTDTISLNLSKMAFTVDETDPLRILPEAKFYLGGLSCLMPMLPPNLLELSLSHSYSYSLLWGTEQDQPGREIPQLPLSLLALHLEIQGFIGAPWRLPKMPALRLLTITTSHVSPEQIASLPPGFKMDNTPDESGRFVAKRGGDKGCAVM
jgi:hypothetical protein